MLRGRLEMLLRRCVEEGIANRQVWLINKVMQSNRIQRLLESCLWIAERPHLHEELVKEIEGDSPQSIVNSVINALEELRPEDIGIHPWNLSCYFVPEHITYTEIISTPQLWIGFFSIPPDCYLPLHDHPAMAVFTKCVLGAIHYRTVDIEAPALNSEGFPVRNITNGVLTAPDVMSISPRAGNIHELHFLENTVMLDVFIPNYGEGRDCTYYSFLANTKATLAKQDEPELNFREHPYEGPQLACNE
mmetsp:Transcript_672/g.1199  ORF Transcript_672/g.1199 Transcript_672/m.1199 type:complete len:247 (-) Transcript_672:734-1474(-)